MSVSNRLISSIFTALPGCVFLALYLASGLLGRDYWWETYLGVFLFLVAASLFLGFVLPPRLHKSKLSQPWMWILVQGALAWLAALLLLGLLNLTPLCIGQDNGDGRNDLAMCIIAMVASAVVYTPVYLSALAVSSLAGHWVLLRKSELKS